MSAKAMVLITILLCVKGLDAIKSLKIDQLLGNFFYRVAFSYIDFFFTICFAPLQLTLLLAIVNLVFLTGYSLLYYEEVSGGDEKANELGETGSSLGPRKLKDHPLINFVRVCASNNDS